MRKLLCLAVVTIVLHACGRQAPSAAAVTKPQSDFLKVGTLAPQFTAATIDGRQVSLSDYRGKTLLLLFATTWCGPCKAESADVIRSYRALHSANVAFLRIDSEEDADTVRAFATEYGEPYPVALDPKGSIVSSGYDMPPAFPIAYVIDPHGVVRGSELRPFQYADYIHAAETGTTYTAPPSPIERAILSRLEPRRFTFTGDQAAIVSQIRAAQADIADIEQSAPPDMDFHPVFARERAITRKMIAALQPVARSIPARTLLLNIELDEAADVPLEASPAAQKHAEQLQEKYARALLALDPSDAQAAWRLVFALGTLKHSSEALHVAEAYAKKYPGVTTYQAVAWYYEFMKNVAGQTVWEDKLLQLQEHQAAASPTDANLESTADEARYLGSLEAQLGHTQRAMQLYQYSLATIARIKHPSKYVALDVQDAETGELALRLAGKTHGTAIFIEPWTGATLPGSTPKTIKYRLVVVAQPRESVQLHAERYADGWLPSFCSDNLCSPIRRTVLLPSSGALTLEFQMIPTAPSAPPVSRVTVVATEGGSTASASLTSRYHRGST